MKLKPKSKVIQWLPPRNRMMPEPVSGPVEIRKGTIWGPRIAPPIKGKEKEMVYE